MGVRNAAAGAFTSMDNGPFAFCERRGAEMRRVAFEDVEFAKFFDVCFARAMLDLGCSSVVKPVLP